MLVGRSLLNHSVARRLSIAFLLRSSSNGPSTFAFESSALVFKSSRLGHPPATSRGRSTTSTLKMTESNGSNGGTIFASFQDASKHVSQNVLGNYNHKNSGDAEIRFQYCGSLACQKDSFQRRLDSSMILSVAAFEEKEAGKGKKKSKKQQQQQPTALADLSKNGNPKCSPIKYAVAVSDSIIFPEGGGQPPDQGTLRICNVNDDSEENEIMLRVSNAQNVGNVCVLLCEVLLDEHGSPNQKAEHFLLNFSVTNDKGNSEPVTATTTTTTSQIIQEIDWDRRFDFMTQHSAQHLISAMALNKFQLGTHSFSLSQSGLTSFIDFKIEEDKYTLEEYSGQLKIVETLVNDSIRQNLSMTPTWLDPKNNPADAELFQTKVRSRLIPDDLVGPIRLVEIGGGDGMVAVDCNTCCGTHVPSLGTLQMIKFFKFEKVKSGIIRIHFAAAQRLIQILEQDFKRSSQITNLLKCPESEHVSRLTTLMEEKRAKESELEAVYKELCTCRAKEIATTCRQEGRNGDTNGAAVAVINLGPNADRNFMALLATATLDLLLDESNKDDKVLLLFVSSTPSSPSDEAGEEGSFLLTGHVGLVDRAGKELAEILGGRGGGKNGKFQGKATKLTSGIAQATTFLKNLKD